MIDWSGIDTVLLDMDGTLLDLAFDNFFWLEHLPREYARHHGLPLAQARELLSARSDALWGSLDWYCLDHWSDALKMDLQALKHEVRHHIRLRPHTPEFLAFLKERGKDVVLVTNAHPTTLDIKVRAVSLHLHVERMVSSHAFRLAKENPGFWDQLRRSEDVDLARSLLIDDSPPVLERARREGVGMTLQMLQPDSTRPPASPADFPGIVHFTEIMPTSPEPCDDNDDRNPDEQEKP